MQSVVKIYPKFELCLLFKFREFPTLHFQQRIKRIILIYHAARRCIFLMPQAATNGIEWLHSAFVFLRCRLRHWKEKFVKLGKFVVKKIRVICAICGFYDFRKLSLLLFVNSTSASMRKRWCSVAYARTFSSTDSNHSNQYKSNNWSSGCVFLPTDYTDGHKFFLRQIFFGLHRLLEPRWLLPCGMFCSSVIVACDDNNPCN